MLRRNGVYCFWWLFFLGVPIGCGVSAGHNGSLHLLFSFPPRTEQWSADPLLVWNETHPFSWWVFVPLAGLVAVCCLPFIVRTWRAVRGKGISGNLRRALPWWGWVGLLMFLGWLPIVWFRPEFATRLQVHSFAIMGLGHTLLMDALAYRRSGTSLLVESRRAFLMLFPASALFWWCFEYLNRFARNWYFVNLESFSAFEYIVCFSLGCATILPSTVTTTTARWLGTFRGFSNDICSGFWRVDVHSPVS